MTLNPFSRFRIVFPLICLGALSSAPAHADAEDTFSLFAGIDRMHDDNLFRTNSGAASDNITTTRFGLQLNKAYSLQRIIANLNFTRYNFNTHDELNYNGSDSSLTWMWSLTPRLHGSLSTSYRRSMNDYTDYNGSNRNLRTTRDFRFSAAWDIVGGWQLTGGLGHYQLDNEEEFMAESDYKSNSVDYGLRYTYPSGSRLALTGRSTSGTYENRDRNPRYRIDSGFDERGMDFQMLWIASGKSRIDATLGYVDRTHDHYSDRDYDGVTGSLNYTWDATGKIRVVANLRQGWNSFQENWRLVSGSQLPVEVYPGSSYYRTRSFTLAPAWQATPKLQVRAQYRLENRDFRGSVFNAGQLGLSVPVSLGEHREDRLHQYSLGVDWAPRNMLRFSANMQHERRNSNWDNFDFDDNIVRLSAQFTF